MGNSAYLQPAPQFTTENAGEMARRATIAREARRAADKEREILRVQPTHAQSRVMKQISRVLTWMDRTKDMDKHAQLSATLDRLWKLAYPTQAAVRSRRSASPDDVRPVEPLP